MQAKQTIITGAVERIRTGLVASLQAYNRIATGDTIKQTETITTADGAKLAAPDYIDDLETGRKGANQPPKYRKPAQLERIRAWCIARGINEGAAYAIKRKVDRVGYQGSVGVISQPLSDKVVDPIIEEALEKVALIAVKEVIDLIKV